MANNISFRDINFADHLDTVTIVVTTDVPCHLFCRLTLEKPRIHSHTVERRGVIFNSELYFCFVAYEDNEQREAGDTLVHSWVKPAWGFCITKYVYFWGYVAGKVSKSTSPFFSHHNTLHIAPPVFTLIFFEEWTWAIPPPSPLILRFTEYWGTPVPAWTLKFVEKWGTAAPPFTLKILEPWTS